FRDKVLRLYGALGRPLQAERESALQLELAHGSRIVSLPGAEANIRGFASVAAVFIDEAARVSTELYNAVRPMLSVSKGAIVLLSTAYAEQGFFYTEWVGDAPWHRVMVKGTDCSRIGADFLAEERAALGPRIFSREYECVFCSADDAAFDYDSVKAAMACGTGECPLF